MDYRAPIEEVALTEQEPPEPSGAVGPDSARDPVTGRFGKGNVFGLVVGQNSSRFWAAHEQQREEIRRSVIADAGYAPDDAPRALRLAADSIAQAALLQASAFERVVTDAGPLSSKGRTRRSYAVWLTASDRLERYLRLVGLRRTPQSAPRSFAEMLAQGAADQAEEP